MELSILPDGVLFIIFSYLDGKTLIRISRVCKRWRTATSSNSLWYEKFLTLPEPTAFRPLVFADEDVWNSLINNPLRDVNPGLWKELYISYKELERLNKQYASKFWMLFDETATIILDFCTLFPILTSVISVMLVDITSFSFKAMICCSAFLFGFFQLLQMWSKVRKFSPIPNSSFNFFFEKGALMYQVTRNSYQERVNNCFIFLYISVIIGATPLLGFFLYSFSYGTWYHFFFTCYAALQICLFFLLNTRESSLKLLSYLLAIIFFRVLSPHMYGAVQSGILLSMYIHTIFFYNCFSFLTYLARLPQLKSGPLWVLVFRLFGLGAFALFWGGCWLTESTLAYFEPKSNVISSLHMKNIKVLIVGLGLSALNVVAPNVLYNVLLTLCLASLGADLGIVYIFLKELSSVGFFSKVVVHSTATSLHLYFSQKQW